MNLYLLEKRTSKEYNSPLLSLALAPSLSPPPPDKPNHNYSNLPFLSLGLSSLCGAGIGMEGEASWMTQKCVLLYLFLLFHAHKLS